MDIKNLIKVTDQKDTKTFFKTVKSFLNIKDIAAAITGILSSERSDLILSAGRIFQASIKTQLLTQLGHELKKYITAGKLKENFCETSINQSTLSELLRFIDEETPDEVRFNAMKSIFFLSVEREVTKENETLAYQLMQVCRKLSSGEILILKAAYDISHERAVAGINSPRQDIGASEWLRLISLQLGHGIPALVEHFEDHLLELKLIGNRLYSDKSGASIGKDFRLSSLGVKLCEFIMKYDEKGSDQNPDNPHKS